MWRWKSWKGWVRMLMLGRLRRSFIRRLGSGLGFIKRIHLGPRWKRRKRWRKRWWKGFNRLRRNFLIWKILSLIRKLLIWAIISKTISTQISLKTFTKSHSDSTQQYRHNQKKQTSKHYLTYTVVATKASNPQLLPFSAHPPKTKNTKQPS